MHQSILLTPGLYKKFCKKNLTGIFKLKIYRMSDKLYGNSLRNDNTISPRALTILFLF